MWLGSFFGHGAPSSSRGTDWFVQFVNSAPRLFSIRQRPACLDVFPQPWPPSARPTPVIRPAIHPQRARAGPMLLIGFGAFALLAQWYPAWSHLLPLGIGLALLVAARSRPRLEVPAGILSGLGVGIWLVSGHLTPGSLHGPIMLESLA